MSQDRIWRYFQNEGLDAFPENEGRIDYIVGRLSKGERILNIGIGNGRLEMKAVQRGLSVFTLDPDEVAVDRASHDLGLGPRARTGYAQEMPFQDSYFDVVVASEVFEHLDQDVLEATLSEICRVLVSGGRLVVTVPAREDLRRAIVVCPDCGHRFHRWGHQQSFDRDTIRELLAQGGFEVEDLQEQEFVNWRALNWKGVVLAGIKRLLNVFGIHGQGETILVEAQFVAHDKS